jgi:hypothetical protein
MELAMEHLGNDGDVQFFRCAVCGRVFVVQNDVTLTIPALDR